MRRKNQPHTLVVGGTRGIGRAVVEAFADAGHRVSAIGRRTVSRAWAKNSTRVWQADLADTTNLEPLIAEILRTNGLLQSVIFLQRFRGDGDPWHGELEVSLTATRTIIELVQDQFNSQRGGAIVVVGSIAGQLVAEEQSVGYHAVKGALRQLVRYYACLLGPCGIRVNCVSPGVILKPEAEKFYRLNKKLMALYERIAPLRRFGTAAEVANVVRFLCSNDSAFITGQDIVVDGGISLAWQASLARELVGPRVTQMPVAARGRSQLRTSRKPA
jgi:NAD(P)-dependent dehydrogenase (short-subunit alcohol dehydrogenase family)